MIKKTSKYPKQHMKNSIWNYKWFRIVIAIEPKPKKHTSYRIKREKINSSQHLAHRWEKKFRTQKEIPPHHVK